MTTTQPQRATEIPDKADRTSAVRERMRNVVMDAGAGTGKTTILVERAVEMIAPEDDGPHYPLSRMAALTFTRKAAGELRLRLRERILARLAEDGLSETRRRRLKEALDEIDIAFVGTIHSFADRLLRLHPVEAKLSPTYEIAEETDALIAETAAILVEGAQKGSLEGMLAGTNASTWAEEATQTIKDALLCGIRREDAETEWATRYGLSGLVSEFVNQRDVTPELPEAKDFDHFAFREATRELLLLTQGLTASSAGVDWLLRLRKLVARHTNEQDPVRLRQALVPRLRGAPKFQLGNDFDGDKATWAIWKDFIEGKKRDSGKALRDEILAPLDEWLALRLVRLFPVVIALYEKVKASHGVIDQIDLLLKLRDLLATNKEARSTYQRMFDHVFIDEFQDTDPLQAEVVTFLCEEGAKAERYTDVELAAGRLTLVGDPKQSIYRFRRADIAMYERVRGMVARGEHLSIRLFTNFRSKPSLIDWFNQRFEAILGKVGEGAPIFDTHTGAVAYQPLVAGRQDDAGPSVHVLPLEALSDDGDKPSDGDHRRVEAQALARYLRWLVERSDVHVFDPKSSRHRPVRYGDIAVLAGSTANLRLLFPELDGMGIPHSVRGGTLFLSDPLHRQLLLALRAIADRDDGIANAALLRPPFFAIDLADLAAERSAAEDDRDPRIVRVREARAIVKELRRQRFERSPGATMRDLLEKTALARFFATGANGAQRVQRLFELSFALDMVAIEARLDFDAAAERLRAWALDPVNLDPPHPISGNALQILTMHQSKGLEYPVTVLWDARAKWSANRGGGAFRIDRDGQSWALSLDGLNWRRESSPGRDLGKAEASYANEEKKRLVYVGATRARDLLVLPKAGELAKGLINHKLLEEPAPPCVEVLDTYREGSGASWTEGIAPISPLGLDEVTSLDHELLVRWQVEIEKAKRPRLVSTSVSKEAQEHASSLDGAQPKRRRGRFGPIFGETVHGAIAAILLGRAPSIEEAVRRAAKEYGLDARLETAIDDVRRAVDALTREGLIGDGATFRLEYPIARASSNRDKLLVGHVDLVTAKRGVIDVVDFKTDAPPGEPLERSYPHYIEQVRTYGEMLTKGHASLRLGRLGLLFTADGQMRWVEPRP